MTRRSPVPPSPAFETIARGAQFRDRITVVVKAPPEAIFQALREVTLREMKFAWLLGELRYLPSRLAGHIPCPNEGHLEELIDIFAAGPFGPPLDACGATHIYGIL